MNAQLSGGTLTGPPMLHGSRHGWALFGALTLLDPSLAVHSARSTAITLRLADELGTTLGDEDFWGVLLHDIGTVNVPMRILAKPGPLTRDEFGVIGTHPILSAELLAESSELRRAVPVAMHHHERWDGKGYPAGLAGDDIPCAARLLAVADAFVALTAPRPHRMAFTLDETVRIIQAEAGAQFDPRVSAAFAETVEAMEPQLKKYRPPAQMLRGDWGLVRFAERATDLSRGQLEALFSAAIGLDPEKAAGRAGRTAGTHRNWISSVRRSLACPPRRPLPQFLAEIGRRLYASVASTG